MEHTSLSHSQQQLLLSLARHSIQSRLQYDEKHRAPKYEEDFGRIRGACFVTLTINEGDLRGCMGSLQQHRSLVEDVRDNACSAAFNDPRFTPLNPQELEKIKIEISVLSPLQEMQFTDEQNLLAQILPFEDGLVLQDGLNRGTFLPLVWEKLPSKQQFLSQLKLKAGLPVDYWSDTLKCFRYHTEVFEEA